MRRDEVEGFLSAVEDCRRLGVMGLLFGPCKYQSEPDGSECLERSAEISYIFRGVNDFNWKIRVSTQWSSAKLSR